MRVLVTAVLLGGASASALAQAPLPAPAVPAPPSDKPVMRIKSFKPQASVSAVQFDPGKVQLTAHNRRWALTHEGKTIKEFGLSERDARQALRLIRQYKLDEVCRIGSGGMEYWLTAGKAPVAPLRAGLRTVSFEPAALRVDRLQGQWCVRDSRRVISAFGPSEADAQKALEVIRAHGFHQAGLVGQVVPTMTVYFGREATSVPVLKVGTSAPEAHKSMPVQRFPRLAMNKDGTPKAVAPRGPGPGLDGLAPPLIAPLASPLPKEKQRPFWHSRADRAVPAPPSPDGRVAFDWRRVELRMGLGQADLTTGGHVLIRFGANSTDARTALSALRYYRCNEMFRLPGDWASQWFVVPQVAPKIMMFGLHADEIKPDKMQVVQVGSRFALAEGERVVLPMGGSAEEAARLLELMQKRHIDRVTRLGPPGEGVAFLLRSR